jgi:hypothetical protein
MAFPEPKKLPREGMTLIISQITSERSAGIEESFQASLAGGVAFSASPKAK